MDIFQKLLSFSNPSLLKWNYIYNFYIFYGHIYIDCTISLPHTHRCQYFCTALYWMYNFSTPHTSMSIFLYCIVLNVHFWYPTHHDVNIFVLDCTECTFLVPHSHRCQYFCTALYWMYIFGTPHTSISIFLYSTVLNANCCKFL